MVYLAENFQRAREVPETGSSSTLLALLRAKPPFISSPSTSPSSSGSSSLSSSLLIHLGLGVAARTALFRGGEPFGMEFTDVAVCRAVGSGLRGVFARAVAAVFLGTAVIVALEGAFGHLVIVSWGGLGGKGKEGGVICK